MPSHNRETSVTLTCIVEAVYEGLGVGQILIAYQSHLVGFE